MNSARRLTVVCPKVDGSVKNPLMPSLLKVEYSSPAKKLVSFAAVGSSVRLAEELF